MESHVDCDLNVFTMYPVGIWALVPSVRDRDEDSDQELELVASKVAEKALEEDGDDTQVGMCFS